MKRRVSQKMSTLGCRGAERVGCLRRSTGPKASFSKASFSCIWSQVGCRFHRVPQAVAFMHDGGSGPMLCVHMHLHVIYRFYLSMPRYVSTCIMLSHVVSFICYLIVFKCHLELPVFSCFSKLPAFF